MPQGLSRFLSSDLPLDPCLLVWESKDYGGTESWKSVTPGHPWEHMPCHFALRSSLSCHTEPPNFDFEKLVLEVQSIHNILLGDRTRSWVSSCPRAYLDSKQAVTCLRLEGHSRPRDQALSVWARALPSNDTELPVGLDVCIPSLSLPSCSFTGSNSSSQWQQ